MDHKCGEPHSRPMAAPVMAVHPCPAKPEMDDLRESLSRSAGVARAEKRLLITARMKQVGHGARALFRRDSPALRAAFAVHPGPLDYIPIH